MGGAIVRSLLKGKYPGKILAADFQTDRIRGLEKMGAEVTTDNRQAARSAEIVIVSVKPGDLEKVLKEISQEIEGKLLISTAATVPIWCLKKNAPDAKIVRIMPNVAALVQSSYTAFCCDSNVTVEDKTKVREILNMIGISEEVDEEYMDAMTGLSGSGPGYLSIIAESLTYAGLKVGLSRDIAEKAAAQNLLGIAKLILELHEQPANIRNMVTTPGGTTIEAIYELEGSGVRQAIIRAVEKATKKSSEIREKICPNRQ